MSQFAIVQPTPKRRAKLEALAQRHLDAGKFSPTEAGSFAGKAGFFDSITLGRVGRAALKPVFLPDNTRSSTRPACRLRLQPPLDTSFVPVPVIHADAYFALGDQKFRACDMVDNQIAFSAAAVPDLENGFGAILPVLRCLRSEGSSSSSWRHWYKSWRSSFSITSCLVLTSRSWTTLRRSSLWPRRTPQTTPSTRWRRSSGPRLEFSGLDRGLRGYRPRRTFRIRLVLQDFSDVARLQASHVPVSFEKVWPLLLDAVHNHQFADESVGLRAIDLLLTSSLP